MCRAFPGCPQWHVPTTLTAHSCGGSPGVAKPGPAHRCSLFTGCCHPEPRCPGGSPAPDQKQVRLRRDGARRRRVWCHGTRWDGMGRGHGNAWEPRGAQSRRGGNRGATWQIRIEFRGFCATPALLSRENRRQWQIFWETVGLFYEAQKILYID